MVRSDSDRSPVTPTTVERTGNHDLAPLKALTWQQVELIDAALFRAGPFAEVRLIKKKGKLRFIQKLESQSAL